MGLDERFILVMLNASLTLLLHLHCFCTFTASAPSLRCCRWASPQDRDAQAMIKVETPLLPAALLINRGSFHLPAGGRRRATRQHEYLGTTWRLCQQAEEAINHRLRH